MCCDRCSHPTVIPVAVGLTRVAVDVISDVCPEATSWRLVVHLHSHLHKRGPQIFPITAFTVLQHCVTNMTSLTFQPPLHSSRDKIISSNTALIALFCELTKCWSPNNFACIQSSSFPPSLYRLSSPTSLPPHQYEERPGHERPWPYNHRC